MNTNCHGGDFTIKYKDGFGTFYSSCAGNINVGLEDSFGFKIWSSVLSIMYKCTLKKRQIQRSLLGHLSFSPTALPSKSTE